MVLSPASSSSSQTKRQLSHVRLIILLTTALNTLDIKTNTSDVIHWEHFQHDINYCRICFEAQIESCQRFLPLISEDREVSMWQQLLQILPQRSCKRDNKYVTIRGNGHRAIAKYFASSKELWMGTPDCEHLKENFLHQDRLDGMQLHPPHLVDDFISAVHLYHKALPKVTLWLYMSVNIQPILMPILYDLDFPVPKTYSVCGFTVYQEYAGLDLFHFYNKDFQTKLIIAKHLLEAALKFSYGFGNYRLYITDLTADNIVYDTKKDRLSFIDLDTVFVVDFREAKYKSSIHKHEYIECPGCFAYSPDDITAHNISDINIYSVCQFLREDLYKDISKGFLYPIPENVSIDHPRLLETLNRCVDCPSANCLQRFSVAKELLNVFEEVLCDFNKT